MSRFITAKLPRRSWIEWIFGLDMPPGGLVLNRGGCEWKSLSPTRSQTLHRSGNDGQTTTDLAVGAAICIGFERRDKVPAVSRAFQLCDRSHNLDFTHHPLSIRIDNSPARAARMLPVEKRDLFLQGIAAMLAVRGVAGLSARRQLSFRNDNFVAPATPMSLRLRTRLWLVSSSILRADVA